ncbi:type IV toxin-antitoxin system AbiEi family antitoxin domain-containing protein [Dactylosporangium siamense]|uniref:type IV toxin-antitoxin system AbiEi family antitoxin domain-containing protein n=1 Tax=Dactylosporangium siamense TaxID=685454 RepID=UPI0019440873|nr:type IV toxin-antitoxin system AbiEi family antitoxin domain-containing protein [Dactylosporangium siamense]
MRAEEQAGVITRGQAVAEGISADQIRRRLRTGRWQRAFAGVYYTFSGKPTRPAVLWAALLTAGPDAVLSHQTAAELIGLIDRPEPPIHVSVPWQRHVRPIEGVWTHRRHRTPTEASARDPARTGVEDTVVDLTQAAKDVDAAVAWIARACNRRLTTPDRLRMAFSARERLRWREALTAAVADVAAGCHSVLELRYLRDVERPHGLPPGTRQRRRQDRGATTYSDVEYEPFGLVVELDGRAVHEDPGHDRLRDHVSAVRGRITLRFGWADVHRRPCVSAAAVAVLLRRAGWPSSPTRCGPKCRLPG